MVSISNGIPEPNSLPDFSKSDQMAAILDSFILVWTMAIAAAMVLLNLLLYQMGSDFKCSVFEPRMYYHIEQI